MVEMGGGDWLIARAGDGSVASGWSEMELPQPRNLAVKGLISMRARHNEDGENREESCVMQ